MKKIFITFLFFAGMITACGDNSPKTENSPSTPSSNTTPASTATAASPTTPAATSGSSDDTATAKDIPLSDYIELPNNYSDTRVLYALLRIALDESSFTDEKKLEFLSSKYYNERDSFKRRDMQEEELQKVNAMLEPYRNLKYVIIPFRKKPGLMYFPDPAKKADPVPQLAVYAPNIRDSFDFDINGFPLHSGQDTIQCWKGSHGDLQNGRFTMSVMYEIDLPCLIQPESEADARTISDLFTKHSFKEELKGDAYVEIYIENQQLRGRVHHIENIKLIFDIDENGTNNPTFNVKIPQ